MAQGKIKKIPGISKNFTLFRDMDLQDSSEPPPYHEVINQRKETLITDRKYVKPPVSSRFVYTSELTNRINANFSPHDKNRRHRIRSREARLVMPDIPPVSASSHEASPASTPGKVKAIFDKKF